MWGNNMKRKIDIYPIVIAIICVLYIAAIGIFIHSCEKKPDTPVEDTTIIETSYNGDFVPSPEAEFVYVVDREDYYHKSSACGAILTENVSKLHKDVAIHLGFIKCPICGD